MKRRVFTETCLFAAHGILAKPSLMPRWSTQHKKPKKVPKTDTHVHLFDLENLSYGWLKNAPEINRPFNIFDFRAASKKSNIDKIVFMESGADAGLGVKEAKWVAGLVTQEPRIKGIIAKLQLDQGEQTKQTLSELSKIDLLKGVRGGFPEHGAKSKSFLEGLKLLAARNLSFDLLLTPPRLEEAAKVAKKCPQNSFILDHLGNPDVKAGEMENWRKGIESLAQLPNVHCKISGIITRAGKEWSLDQIEPYIMYVIEKFGVKRLVYGGDWPVVLRAGSYRSWSKAFEKLTKKFSDTELHQMYHTNADRIYNL